MWRRTITERPPLPPPFSSSSSFLTVLSGGIRCRCRLTAFGNVERQDGLKEARVEVSHGRAEKIDEEVHRRDRLKFFQVKSFQQSHGIKRLTMRRCPDDPAQTNPRWTLASQSRSRVDRSLPPPEVVIDSIEYLAREQPTKRAEQTCLLTYYRLLDAFSAVASWNIVLQYTETPLSLPRVLHFGAEILHDSGRPLSTRSTSTEVEKPARQKLGRSCRIFIHCRRRFVRISEEVDAIPTEVEFDLRAGPKDTRGNMQHQGFYLISNLRSFVFMHLRSRFG